MSLPALFGCTTSGWFFVFALWLGFDLNFLTSLFGGFVLGAAFAMGSVFVASLFTNVPTDVSPKNYGNDKYDVPEAHYTNT